MEGEGEVVLGLNQAPSMNAVLRALKREEASMFNCVASIAGDAQFVEQVAARYPALPLFPNLRCGLWYVRPPIADTCYFKSTDGHNNNWSFSTVRLNLNVAEAAARAGGCLVVDATKRGKRFPDAMSKTVPMWAAVMNRAVQRVRQRQREQQQQQQQAAAAPAAQAAAEGAAVREEEWDCDVHLPPWVSDVEANSIRQRLEGWADQLLEVGADLSIIAATLRKPLRCMWVTQESRMWEEAVADADSLAFTPIILVGASATTARQRRCLTLPTEAGEGELSVGYSYFPGAADDEESWACGLTPELMWRHVRGLLAAGPAGIEPLAQQLVSQQQQQRQQEQEQEHVPSLQQAAGQQHPQHHQQQQQQQQQLPAAAARAAVLPSKRGSSSAAAAPLLEQDQSNGLHCLLPAGCRPAQPAAVQQVASGVFLLGSTGLALSSGAAAAAAAVWQHVDAVLHLGQNPVPGMQSEPQPLSAGRPAGREAAEGQAGEAKGGGGGEVPSTGGEDSSGAQPNWAGCRYCWLPVRSSKQERHSLQQQLQPALQFASAQLRQRRRLLLCCDSGLDASVCAAVTCLLAFYRLEQQPGGGTLPVLAMPPAAAAADGALSDGQPPFSPVVGIEAFSKLTVRQHLAAVSAHYPAARPTRGSLRQVFNFFLTDGSERQEEAR